MKAFSVVLVTTLALAGCSGSPINPVVPPSVQAAPPPVPLTGPSPQLWNGPVCTLGTPQNVAEAFARGNIQPDGSTVDEGDDFLEISSPVYSAGCIMTVKYTTQFAHNVQSIQYQMGSGKDAIQEWAFWVDATLPTGKQINSLKKQFDKHTDFRGNGTGEFAANLVLPAGTVIRMQRPMVICVTDPSPYDCITGQSVSFVAKTP